METPTKLPLDVLGYIADVLGDDSLRGTNQHTSNALKMLCLTCKFMVPICRRHLFANVELSLNLRQRKALVEFLLEHPTITMHYVKSLHIILIDTQQFSTSDCNLLQVIRASSSLTSLEICSIGLFDWDKYADQPKSIYLSLIQMPTLRRLALHSMDNIPASTLSLCSGLKELALYGSCSLAPPGADDTVQSLTIATLVIKSYSLGGDNHAFASLLNPTGQHTIIAFDCLKNVSVRFSMQAEIPHICKLLESAVCLERLEITSGKCSWVRDVRLAGLGSNLAANPRPKIRSVTLDLHLKDDSPLCDLNFELGQLAGKNVLEVLEVKSETLTTGWDLNTMHWPAEFDQLVTDVGAFPALRQVTFNLKRPVLAYETDPYFPSEISEAWFPRLLESRAIDFKLQVLCPGRWKLVQYSRRYLRLVRLRA